MRAAAVCTKVMNGVSIEVPPIRAAAFTMASLRAIRAMLRVVACVTPSPVWLASLDKRLKAGTKALVATSIWAACWAMMVDFSVVDRIEWAMSINASSVAVSVEMMARASVSTSCDLLCGT